MPATNYPPVIYVDIYESKSRRHPSDPRYRAQNWRWRALSEGNRKKLASSGEAYANRQDCLDAIRQLFGSGSTVYLRESEQGNVAIRMAVAQGWPE